jgi:hypothetical protein
VGLLLNRVSVVIQATRPGFQKCKGTSVSCGSGSALPCGTNYLISLGREGGRYVDFYTLICSKNVGADCDCDFYLRVTVF